LQVQACAVVVDIIIY